MAEVKNNLLLQGFSGSVGELLTFKQIAGRTFATKRRIASYLPPTAKAIQARTKFAHANVYAKKVVGNPDLKALYQKAVKGAQRAYNVAIMDALNAPVVNGIDVSAYFGNAGDLIVVQAQDDFKVSAVKILIHDGAGNPIETGNAELQTESKEEWIYRISESNSDFIGSQITATAFDLPGNQTSLNIIR